MARIRFAGEQFVTGTGTVGGSNSTNFVLSNDGSGDTVIKVGNTVTVDTSIAVTGTVAQWAGVTNGATTDWSTAGMWADGTGAGGVPGQFQTAQIALTGAQATLAISGTFDNYVLTISTAETAGSVLMDDPLATLAVSAPLTLSGIPGQSGGGGFITDTGVVDIKSGGTVTTSRFLTNGDLSLEPGALLSIAGNAPFTFGSGLAGLDVEKSALVTGATISSAGNITVGANGNGSMIAQNSGTAGALVADTYTQVGGNPAVTGADSPQAILQITGPNTDWFDTNTDTSTPLAGAMIVGGGAASLNGLDQITIGAGGSGLVQISDGAVAVEAAYALIAAARGSQGEVDVSNGGTWFVGTGDVGTPGSIVLGNTIVGTSTLFGSNLPQLVVGSGGAGTLNVNSGSVILGGAAAFDADRMFIGTGNAGNNAATGVVNVQGTGALLNAPGPVTVSLRSNGVLNVTNSGTVFVAGDPTVAHIEDGLLIGNQNGTVGANAGTVNVNTGGLLADDGDVVVGRNSQGFLNVGGGGSVHVNGELVMGGLIALINNGTPIAATLFKGSSSGTLSITGNGEMTVNGNTIDMFQGGTTTATPSTIDLNGSGKLVLGNASGITPAAGELTVAAGATLQGAGAVVVNSTDSTLRNFGTVLAGGLTSNGTLVQNNTTLDLNAVLAGSGVFELAPGGAMRLDNGVVTTANFDFGTANFGANPAHSEIIVVAHPVAFQGTVADFYGGKNKIDFLNDPLSSQPTYDAASGLVTVNGTLSFHVTGVHTGFSAASDGAGGTMVTANDATPCFAAGTRILTACGEVAAEALRVGDRVPARSGALRHVRWIGRTRVMVDDATAPVAVAANAFAPGVPHAPLVLSPDHAVLAGDALVPVRYLANGGSIARAAGRGAVEYFHVELDLHDVLFADGLAAESYLDTGNRAQFAETLAAVSQQGGIP